MKKNYIKLLFVSFFLFLVFPLGVNASNGYTIENYEVDIKVNENMQTSIKNVYAGGDIVGEKQTVAWAARSGRDAAENILKFL